jgi:hypothetical protein
MSVEYIRQRAARLREAASKTMDPDSRADYRSGAKYLDLVAEEIHQGLHL